MNHQTVVLDVREEIRNGAAPCDRIRESAGQLNEGDSLKLIAPFEPTPLYEVLGREGFSHDSHEIGCGDWEVTFTKDQEATAGRGVGAKATGAHGRVCGCSSEGVLDIDARGLEPPEPMMRILEVVATLPAGATLRALTDRRPVWLYDQLELRGYRAVSSPNPDGGVVTHIRPR